MKTILFLFSALAIAISQNANAGKQPKQVFIPMDYSTCGYHASEKSLPQIESKLYVSDAKFLQSAIDKISTMKLDKNGFRGAVLLGEGVFIIDKPLRISASGIALRGMGRDKTIIIKRGCDRGAAIYVEGGGGDDSDNENDNDNGQTGKSSSSLREGLGVGSRILIYWTADKNWIKEHKCDDFGGGLDYTGWKEGDIQITWNRTIVGINGDSLTLDAPITMFGCTSTIKASDFEISTFDNENEISEIGIENLTISSQVNDWNPKDEDHCWTGIYMDNARDCWIDKVNFKHFAGSAVNLQRGCSRITVQDCIASEPVSEIGGWRRNVFITRGQQTLFQRCISRHGIHDFAAGYCAPGPNAFVQCEGEESMGFSGSIGAWAPGLLFDIVNIDGNDIALMNLEQFRTGTGWNTGNSMVWQCTAANIKCYSPDAGNKNSGHGCWGCLWGDAEWTSSNDHVNPRSLFYHQLSKRLESKGCKLSDVMNPYILPRNTDATSSPTVEQAQKMAQESLTTPRLTMEMWIRNLENRALGNQKFRNSGIQEFRGPGNQGIRESGNPQIPKSLNLSRLIYSIPWWNGRTKDSWVTKSARPAITRFVPGYEGTGWTDRIDDVVKYLKDHKFGSLDHHYGLWYDLRRIDHERIRRSDGCVEAPFYEQPFARSGQGTAWDGLSKYDLTKPNEWYWSRLREFADKAAAEKIFLYNQMYFQHNILEAGAHWVDCPWRFVNNINCTTFPEPVPFAGDKRIFLAEQFYNVEDSILRPLHRHYIRMCLEQLKDNPNVVHFISAEYTGPLHFTKFWLETISEWETETGFHPLIALSCTKDAQDAILADSVLSKVVDIIDIRYWHYSDKGLWAPEAGKNLAPRQWARKFPVGKTSMEDMERAINEYKERYPDKIVIYSAGMGF